MPPDHVLVPNHVKATLLMTAALIGLVLSITTAVTPDISLPSDITHSPVVDPFLRVTSETADTDTELPLVVTEWGAMNCPVAGDHYFIDSWGYARSGGRRHQGTDIMADRHTPVVAVTNGTITKVDRTDRKGELGGRTLWLETDDGVRFYYAHLQSIVDDLRAGDRVAAGDVLASVGNSGNARKTAPHLHFEIRPGKKPVNPYPTLAQVCRGAR
ncbi:MAG TPA: M23 family metallopeptidase [Acidimicrobiia bacterium]|nr:M23 family metallopeptidase [Acidimicrobiia bacterium]